jgi:nucleotide-binding universal stress UspA family protein
VETSAPGIRIDTSPRFDACRPIAASRRGLPEPAARFLAHAIAADTSPPERVSLAMHGHIKVDPAHVLITASTGADLLVLGGHGHTRLFHAVIGSVTEIVSGCRTAPSW